MSAPIVIYQPVLDFWFGTPDSVEYGKSRSCWFTKSDEFDSLIRERFGSQVSAALDGRHESWLAAPASALAYIITLDQFTRNIFRGQAAAFSGDARALAAARLMVAKRWDQGLPPVQRSFCYLPFEHSENLADQDESVRLYGLLDADPKPGGLLEWAVKHRDIIVRFGRFPHRNETLRRASTPEEHEFLKQPGSRF